MHIITTYFNRNGRSANILQYLILGYYHVKLGSSKDWSFWNVLILGSSQFKKNISTWEKHNSLTLNCRELLKFTSMNRHYLYIKFDDPFPNDFHESGVKHHKPLSNYFYRSLSRSSNLSRAVSAVHI
jgi:GT2 family glycosyltransferase